MLTLTSAFRIDTDECFPADSSSDSEIDLLAAPSKRPSSSAPQYQTAPLSTPTSISLAPKALKSKLPSSSDTDAEPDLLAPLTPVPSWVSRAEVEPTRPDPGHVTPAAVPAPTSTPTSAPARPLDPEQDAELTARPAFAPSEAQKGIGPLVLDERAGVQVPATINRFLRDYQREGEYSEVSGYLPRMVVDAFLPTSRHTIFLRTIQGGSGRSSWWVLFFPLSYPSFSSTG